MITVYSVETGNPVQLHPIDAREQLALGLVVREAPADPPPAPLTTAAEAISKAELVAKAGELGVAAPSTLARWGVDKLKASIAEAEG
jgi:hypothetical protein